MSEVSASSQGIDVLLQKLRHLIAHPDLIASGQAISETDSILTCMISHFPDGPKKWDSDQLPADIHPYDFIAHAGKAAAVSLQKLPLGDPNALRQLLQGSHAAEISGGFSNLLRFLGFSVQLGLEKGQREGFEESEAQQEVSHVLFHTGELREVLLICEREGANE
jgi:hypothetical protein